MQKYNIGILGASGYTGAELLRLLLQHPYVNIAALAAHSQAGQEITQIFPHFAGMKLPFLNSINDVYYDNIDILFCCLPHATSQIIIKNIPDHVKVIDLSADFRLRDSALYEKWYGQAHQAIELSRRYIHHTPSSKSWMLSYLHITVAPAITQRRINSSATFDY
jgi:N-acetyl-gamma-glutamyl-phosphate reductase